MTVFDDIDLTKKYDFTLVLTRKNKKPIAILHEAYDRVLERNLETLDKLSFSIPKYLTDEIEHKKIENPNYDLIIEENMVLLKCGEAINPIFEGYFIIKNITESLDKLSKQVECSSREVMLNKNTITMDGIERQLVKDDVNISDGIFDILSQETSWSLGHIDENAKVEHINNGTNNKYRWFDAFSKPWYGFLKDDVTSAFNVLLTFDTINKKVNVYDKDSYGKHTGIILSENNYIKNLSKKTNSENIVTKLVCSGRNGLIFNDVNIYGGDFIFGYSFFKNNGQMSDELISALDNYDIVLNQKNIEFQNIRTQIDSLNSQLTTKNSEMTALNEDLNGLKHIQSGYMASNDNTHLPQATQDVNNKVAEIGQKKNEIINLQSQIDSFNSQLTTIANDIDKKNVKYNNILIFNNDLLDELEEFTYMEDWSSNYIDSPTLLLNEAKKVLADWCVPPVEYELDVVDLFACAEEQRYWDKINLGDFIRIYSDRIKTNVDARIVSYTYNIDNNDLKFTVSNKNKKNDDARNIGAIQKRNNEASKIVNTKKLEWNNVKDVKNAVDLFLNNSLDLARQSVISKLGRNKINIDENGIFVIDADNENNQVAILSGLVAFTDDGWQTANTALDNSGIYSQYLVGQIILGEKLFIQDETGQLSIIGNLLTIKDDQNNTRVRLGKYTTNSWGLQILSKNNGQVVLDENGILQSYSFAIADNVDSTHSLKAKFYIPPNVLSVRSVNLAFSLEKFRAYEKSIIGGSSSKSTSDGGGVHRHRMFKFSDIPPSITPSEQYFICSSQDASLSEVYTSIATDELYDLHTYDASSQHSHGMAHTHTSTLEYGIYESTYPSNIKIIIDGTLRDGSNYNGDQQNIELSQWINSGWHTIELQSDSLGRINASLFVSCFVSS